MEPPPTSPPRSEGFSGESNPKIRFWSATSASRRSQHWFHWVVCGWADRWGNGSRWPPPHRWCSESASHQRSRRGSRLCQTPSIGIQETESSWPRLECSAPRSSRETGRSSTLRSALCWDNHPPAFRLPHECHLARTNSHRFLRPRPNNHPAQTCSAALATARSSSKPVGEWMSLSATSSRMK